jgi:hypothetical protein
MENNPNKNSRRFILWAGLTFCLPMALLYGYSLLEFPISIFGFELKKITQSEPNTKIEDIKPIFDKQTLNKSTRDSIQAIESVKKNSKKDSLLIKTISENGEVEEVVSLRDSIPRIKLFGNDSVSHRVLIMGDSESGGLCFQLYDYCQENGHNLVAALNWYSASIFNLAYADTVNDVIKKYKPTYIFIVVGLNEMYAKDLNNRRKAAQILAKKISGIPYTWIGPANYREDYGINQVFKESAEPGTYYLTKQLDLPKGGDKRHPSKVGYRIWMDSLAVWLQTEAKYKIKMNPPVKRNRLYRSKIITLNAAKYRGY